MASIYRRKKGGTFYITYQVRPGQRKTVKGCKDRAATEALARKLEADAMLRREGVIDTRADQYAKAEARPLVDRDAGGKVAGGHLADHHAALLAKGVTRDHADLVRTRANKVLKLAKAERVSHLSPSAVQGAIASIREEGLSLQTCNDTLRAVKQFSRWLWRDGRAREDVLAHLTGYNVALDRRHDRRSLTDEELARLIAAAEKGPVIIRITGPDRAMLYRVAVGTGFRANELRSLAPESFDLDAEPPMVTVQAAYSKHRRQDVQPIRQDLADLLRPWLEARSAGEPVFGTMPEKTARMMRQDLEAAKQEWVEEVTSPEAGKERADSSFLAYRDSAGRVADFHALRHTYVSRLVKSGANIKVAQELARHSTPILTLGRYAHVEVLDQTKALAALPPIDTPCGGREAVRATGTDDSVPPRGDGPKARSALSARRRPEPPAPAASRQDGASGGLDSAGAQAVQLSRLTTSRQDLSALDNISSHLSSMVEHRFRKAGVPGSNPGGGSRSIPPPLRVAFFLPSAAVGGMHFVTASRTAGPACSVSPLSGCTTARGRRARAGGCSVGTAALRHGQWGAGREGPQGRRAGETRDPFDPQPLLAPRNSLDTHPKR